MFKHSPQAKQCIIEINAYHSLQFHQNSISSIRDRTHNGQREGRSIAPPDFTLADNELESASMRDKLACKSYTRDEY